MSIELPGWLTEALSLTGMSWPAADEDALFAAAGAWTRYAGALRDVEAGATAAAASVWSVNSGPAVDAFRQWWADQPRANLRDDAPGCEAIGVILDLFGAATIALKGVYLVQLGVLAASLIEAAATAFVTFGASLAEIPIVTQLVRSALESAVQDVVYRLLF